MNLLQIAWRNILQRGFASGLTMLSMALGVALVVLVLSIGWVITESFRRNSGVGYNMIVGAKGGALQLTLNTAFYLSKPIEVIPYEEYLEYLPGNQRQEEIRKIGGRIAEPDRPGKYSLYMGGGFAIPVCLGDYFGRFRVVGTKPEFFDLLEYGEASTKYSFADGRNFEDYNEEHGYFEGVVGSLVAAEMNVKVGDTIKTTHGDPDGKGHGEGFTVVGILDPTGTPTDRAAFINLEGFYKMDGHQRDFVDKLNPDELKEDVERDEAWAGQPPRLELEKRDLIAVLVRPGKGMFAMRMQKEINKRPGVQAVSPLEQIGMLLGMVLEPIKYTLLVLTTVVCCVSAVSILVSIYNSMNDRKRDIAVMRALGARRDAVVTIILAESVLIALGGGILGWVVGHGAGALMSGFVETQTGVKIGFLTITDVEWTLVPGLMLLAILAGIIPAFVAYRTDVSKSLVS